MKIQSHKDLIVWKKSMDLVTKTYELTTFFQNDEKYVLAQKMKRAAISIPSNIAEGYRRKYKKEYARFISIVFGSVAELETQVEICKNLPKFSGYNFEKIENLLSEILPMLNVLLKK